MAGDTSANSGTESTNEIADPNEAEGQVEAGEGEEGREHEEPEPEEHSLFRDEPTPRSWRTAAIVAAAAAVVFLVAAVAMALAADNANDRLDATETDLDAVRAVAAEVTEALVSFDHRRPDANREKLKGLASRPVIAEYERLFPSMKEFGNQVKGAITVSVKGVYVSEIDDDEASAVVESDVDVSSKSGTRAIPGVYTRVSLTKSGEGWTVTRVEALNNIGGLGPLPSGKTDG